MLSYRRQRAAGPTPRRVFDGALPKMHAAQYIEALAARGRHHFTTADAVAAVGGSEDAVRAQLLRLKRRGHIASPMRSFHVSVPPEYRRLGCLPPEHFIDPLMGELAEPYYVCLLSAAARHGAAHQRPQSLQVMVERSRPALVCGEVRVQFIARGDLVGQPVVRLNTPRGTVRYATPELTALELVGYPQAAGGLSNVATVLVELAEAIDATALRLAARRCPVGWSQRLGYLFERLGEGALAEVLAPFVEEEAHSFIPLRRARPVGGATRDAKWKVIVNAEVEPDL